MPRYTGGPSPARRSTEHMSEVTSERQIIITDSAARRITALKAQEAAEEGAFLRIAVSGGGCSGFQYGLTFDNETNADDIVFDHGGVSVVVDDVSLDLLNGAEVEFVEDLRGAQVQIHNPNAHSPCL